MALTHTTVHHILTKDLEMWANMVPTLLQEQRHIMNERWFFTSANINVDPLVLLLLLIR